MSENEDGEATYIVVVKGRTPVEVVADDVQSHITGADPRFQAMTLRRDGKIVAQFTSVVGYWRQDAEG